jgi:hypothetical protein
VAIEGRPLFERRQGGIELDAAAIGRLEHFDTDARRLVCKHANGGVRG